ncbi:hypothetical protein A6M21_12300 [Desulfotomaculum copahuensis]|uniref:Uncharacterized protein n=2 Tax=Desulfotomaculum copahuensis TaxID=1838280 RepID=A0A1B7LDC3_9FIRM|nr:hypothetical protein A6M21_12300 [Desulfotomaculum copahuensis]
MNGEYIQRGVEPVLLRSPLVSVVIPCRNEGDYLRQTLQSIFRAGGPEREIIVVDDGSDDGCCDFLRRNPLPGVQLLAGGGLGVANARNFGAAAAKGDCLCFCDAHLFVPAGWLDKITAPIHDGRADVVCPAIADAGNTTAVGYGVTWDGQLQWQWLPPPAREPAYVPLAPGGCLAVSRRAFEDAGGFESGFRVFGYDDQEFSLKMWLFGYRVLVEPAVTVVHRFRTAHPYPVGWAPVIHNRLRMALLHFKEERIARVLEMTRPHAEFSAVMAGLCLGDIWRKRADYLKRRRHSDDWFMERFGIGF